MIIRGQIYEKGNHPIRPGKGCKTFDGKIDRPPRPWQGRPASAGLAAPVGADHRGDLRHVLGGAGTPAWLASVWDLPVLLRAAGFCLLPVWITGGIHLDGFADTSDALASYGDKEKRLAILKDSHCGAFAVIRLCSWFVLDFALWSALPLTIQTVGCMQLGFVLERAISGWAVASLPLAKHRGLAYTFSTASDRRRVKGILTGIILVVSMALVGVGRISGWAMLAAALACLWRYTVVSRRDFGGITGDLAGWFLQRCELWMLAALVAAQLAGF